MKELLENAVLSIELGVEDYQTGDERRVLSAIRNLYAGVLLLCKQVLWNESPRSRTAIRLIGNRSRNVSKSLASPWTGQNCKILPGSEMTSSICL